MFNQSDNVSSYDPVVIVPTIASHISSIKTDLRPKDQAEILRFGISIQHALWRSYRQSVLRKTALIDGRVAAVWGVCGTFMGEVGIPWLMTTPAVKKVSPLKFARIYQSEVLDMLKIFPSLVNYVDSEYTSAIRLLDIIGFDIDDPEPFGRNNAKYRRFSLGV